MSGYGKCLTVLAALVALAGCRNPTEPTPPAPGAVAPPTAGTGAIRLSAVTPGSGTTMTVHDCGPASSGMAGRHVCTNDWRGDLEVEVGRDIANAVVTVAFEGASGRCGEVGVPKLSFTAGQGRVVSTSTAVYMTYEPEFFEPGDRVIQWCGLPTRTERLVVAVWDLDGGPGSSGPPVVLQAYDLHCGFILRQ